MVSERVSERIRELPDRPGIYIFLGVGRRPLYVGKARSLRKRALTYLSGDHEPRLKVMLDEAREIDFLVTDSEAEALLLENNWIKKKRPRFNILLRDDKTYPYLKLSADPYPRVAFTRRILEDGADYFGPFLPAGLARKAIKLVQKLFQLRVCTLEIDGGLPRPCLYYDMRRCLGPCVEGLTSPAEYSEAVTEARLFPRRSASDASSPRWVAKTSTSSESRFGGEPLRS
jgi:excinuclease ABC subunit C